LQGLEKSITGIPIKMIPKSLNSAKNWALK